MDKLWGYIRGFLVLIGGVVVVLMLIAGAVVIVSNISDKGDRRLTASDVATADQAVDQLNAARVADGRQGFIVNPNRGVTPVMRDQSSAYHCSPHPGAKFVEVAAIPGGDGVLVEVRGDWSMNTNAYNYYEAMTCPNGSTIVVSESELSGLLEASVVRLQEIDRERSAIDALVAEAPADPPWFTADRLRNNLADLRVVVVPSGLDPDMCQLTHGQRLEYVGSDAGRNLYRAGSPTSDKTQLEPCQAGTLFFGAGRTPGGG